MAADGLFVLGWAGWRWLPRKKERSEPDAVPARDEPLPDPVSLLFGAEDASLSAEARVVLTDLAARLKGSGLTVTVEGSADASGNPSRNRKLAVLRGANTRRFLVAVGVPAGNIQVTTREPVWGETTVDRDRLRCVTITWEDR